MRKLLPLALILLAGNFLQAQTVTFRLLMHAGEVRVLQGMEVKKLAAGMLLYDGQDITLGEDSYAALVHISGSTIELTQPGRYTVRKLEEQAEFVEAYPNAMRYAEFATGNMTPELKKNRLVASAYEMRSEMEVNRKIRLFIPSAVKVLNETVLLRWELVENASYEVIIRNMHDRELYREEVSENMIRLDLADEALNSDNILLLHVVIKGDDEMSSETYALKRVSDSDRIELMEELETLSPGTNAAEYLILAGFYESKNLLADAMSCYHEAVILAPGVTGYRDAYEEFLLRNHLVQF